MKLPGEYIIAYQKQEMTVYDIANLVRKAPSTVWKSLKNENIDTSRYRKRLKERNIKIVAAYQEKQGTLQEIGETSEISKQRVHQIIKRFS